MLAKYFGLLNANKNACVFARDIMENYIYGHQTFLFKHQFTPFTNENKIPLIENKCVDNIPDARINAIIDPHITGPITEIEKSLNSMLNLKDRTLRISTEKVKLPKYLLYARVVNSTQINDQNYMHYSCFDVINKCETPGSLNEGLKKMELLNERWKNMSLESLEKISRDGNTDFYYKYLEVLVFGKFVYQTK